MCNIGEWVIDSITKEKVQVIEKIELWGFTTYKVFSPTNNNIYKISEKNIEKTQEKQKYDENYIKYITLLTKIKNETAQGILSILSKGIIPLPHQLHVLNRVVSSNNIRYILADEVGLGKTIEAGLIIKELKARGLVKRVLVVCPTGLVTQWNLEMKEKFDEVFHVILPSDFNTIKKITESDDVYGHFNQVISPMDSIKPLEKRAGWSEERIEKYNEERIYSIINSGWDLIIIDEAHRVAGSSSDVSRYKLGNLLAASSPYILLLTATPHSGKTEPFLRLIGLLEPEAFPNYKAIVKEQVSPFIIRSEKREAIDNDGNKLFKERITKVIEIEWDERHTLQNELYEVVSNYVKQGYNRALKDKKPYIGFLMVLMQRLVTSSTAAIKDSIGRRIDILENQQTRINNLSLGDLVESDFESTIDEAIEVVSYNLKQELEELRKILEIAKQAEFQYLDAKVEKLIDILDELHSSHKNKKIIIFTEFVTTQKYLKEFLENKEYKVSILNGSMDIEERNSVLNEFKHKSNILISTDAGGEGLNLQFANVVINYDLPWNPMKIEQRIGRVDRIGQNSDVLTFNFIIKDTIENRVRNVLEDKLSVILSETGIDKIADVLDNELAELDFTDVYIKSIKAPSNLEHNVANIENELRKQIQNANKYKELIREEKDLSNEVFNNTDFDIDKSLRKMLEHYYLWRDNKIFHIYDLSINDEEIVKHLNKEFIFDKLDTIPCIKIKDFPNEKGYFMLWELSINEEKQSKKIIPIFINEDMVLRPLSGKKIWKILASEESIIEVNNDIKLTDEVISILFKVSTEVAYNIFQEMKNKYEKKNKEQYNKYLYAISLRFEAAEKIGIDNIKISRLKSLSKEKQEIINEYERNKNICPVFKPILISCLER